MTRTDVEKWGPFGSHVRLMDTLVAQFGNNCQVSLYDLRPGIPTLVAVAGSVMDVAIGSRLAPALVPRLNAATGESSGKSLFTSATPDGRRLSTSLTVIDDPASGQPIGCLKIDLCIENLISSIDVLQTFCNFGPARPAPAGSIDDIGETVDTLIAQVLSGRSNPRSVAGKAHRMEIVERLDERGVFLVKGAIDIVAGKLNVSKYTLYNYLDQIKKRGSPPSFR
ncbi:MAG: helix-turn-helix domain-containing protein [Bosea sp.]|uniref:helix-turn-helix domain-containing protein n=1 Tax=Bosea sp. (in: a-proteobacteria) TaxID=1871050 RepID=UPI001AC8E99D|nr:helix-turn-helix domain-containing protein [Bosea sp. (in: a-proteobacteria)]MBN9451552.1 helix-turn-helix domain-containing protein [Bosea sp. (in: a-proteobacteria)]